MKGDNKHSNFIRITVKSLHHIVNSRRQSRRDEMIIENDKKGYKPQRGDIVIRQYPPEHMVAAFN